MRTLREPPVARARLPKPAARPPSPADDRTLVVFATALALWSVAYLMPHLYWALGGTTGSRR